MYQSVQDRICRCRAFHQPVPLIYRELAHHQGVRTGLPLFPVGRYIARCSGVPDRDRPGLAPAFFAVVSGASASYRLPGPAPAFHQHREPGPFGLIPHRHRQRFVDLRQQLAPFAVGQKAVVTHHLKMPCRNMADIAPQHLFLADFLAFVLLRAVVVILMNHSAAAVMPELGGRHRRAFQITAKVFHAVPRAPGLFGKVHFPCSTILRMEVAVPPLLVTYMA